jgi:GNAT superfamily N-acetyltransferase
MQLEIELAELADVPDIVHLMKLCMRHMRAEGIGQWDDEYPSFEIVDADAQAHSLFKASMGNHLVGTVTLNDIQPEQYKPLLWRSKTGRALVVRRLCVHPEWQRQGIGAALLKFSLKFAKESGFRSVRLDAYTGNPRAQSLYHRHGFWSVGQAEFRNRLLPFDCFEKIVE